ncbi:MAG: hypothetical protein MOB07_26250 [Acidobacteria bacterium]|nr:hypothetical protein [Acidobacteriota bacterium]
MTNQTSNVHQITDKQPTSSARFQITATIDGFPITVEVEGKADSLRAMIDRLMAIGAVPPAATPAQPEPTKPAGAPVCKVHGSQMKESRKPGTYFCSRRLADGSYCAEKS